MIHSNINEIRKQPTLKIRRDYCPEEAAKRRLDIVGDCKWVYTEIPESILGNAGYISSWMPPTPKPVQDVIKVITFCMDTVERLGRMPSGKVPRNMTDEDIEIALRALNKVLSREFGAWGSGAGYQKPPQFNLDKLSIKSKRAIIAYIQDAIDASKVREIF